MSGMNKSVSTLSKKQKMRLKKSQKRYIITKQPSFIEVISSSGNQQQYANNITKSQKQQQDNQPPKQQLKNKSENRYNNFNFEKIKKSDLSHRQRKPILLQYQQCQDIKDITQYQGRSLISYRKFGQEKLQMISQNHLKNRIDKFNQQIQKIQAQKQKIQAQKDQQEQNQQQFQQGCEEIKNQQPLQNQKKNNFNKALRYFDIVPQKKIDNDSNVQSNDSNDDDNRIVKCFRCGQMGHIARNCYEEAQKIKCMFCLGEHHHSQCTDVLCFKCSNPGHVSQNCTNPGKVCRRCKKRGHIERNCGSILLMDYSNSNDKEIRQKFGVDNLRKLKCLCNCRKPKGHFNCFSYHENPPKIYN